MKKKLKKSLACLLATLLIFSALPMSALADEAAAPVTVTDEITAVEPEEAAAPDADPDAEPKPEITAEPTATPEASTTPSAEPTAVPSPEATEEPTEPETSAEPEATAEPTASPTPNPEDEISLLALGDEAVTRYRTVGINGNFSSNYLYDLGEFPLYDIYRNGVSYPAYCLQHGKGRVNNGAYVQRDNFGMTEAMRRIIAYGYNTTNSLGKNDWYSDATAKTMVTQHLVWLASEGYITVDGTNWSWGSGIDNDVERMANLAYNGSVVRSYYAELKDRLLRSEIVPSFAGKNSDGSDAQEIALQFVNGKYAATVTDTNGVLDLFDFQKAGFDISCNGNTLTISTNTLPEQETTIISAGYTVGDKNSIAVWEDRDQQANIQHQATCPGTTKTTAYIKIKGENPKYTVTLTKTSADVKITNGNANYSLEGAVYRYGLGCDADHETAVHWYTVAAERGSIYAQQRLEVMEMQRIRQEQRAAEYAEKQQQQQNLSFAARLLNTIGNALCRQTLRDQQSATATTDRKQRRMQRRLKRALGQKEDYEQIFQ